MIEQWLRFTYMEESCFGMLRGESIRIYQGDMPGKPQLAERSAMPGAGC